MELVFSLKKTPPFTKVQVANNMRLLTKTHNFLVSDVFRDPNGMAGFLSLFPAVGLTVSKKIKN